MEELLEALLEALDLGEPLDAAALRDRDHGRHDLPVTRGADDGRDLRRAEERRRQIEQGQQRPPGIAPRPRVGAVGEHEREVQEERRQQQHCHHIAPVEDLIEPVEPLRVARVAAALVKLTAPFAVSCMPGPRVPATLKVAPLLTMTVLPAREPLAARVSVPAVTVVPPSKVLLPERMSCPAPVLLMALPGPLMSLAMWIVAAALAT